MCLATWAGITYFRLAALDVIKLRHRTKSLFYSVILCLLL